MPKRIWNEDIVAALRVKLKEKRDKNSPQYFQFERAIDLIRGHRGNITKPEQLAKHAKKGLTQTVLEYIGKLMREEISLPTAAATPVAAGPAAPATPRAGFGYVPGTRTGAYAILLTLDESPQGILAKQEICARAQRLSQTPMEVRGDYGAWKGIDSLEKHGYVRRLRHSQNMARFGGFGMRKDEFEITPLGKQVAAHLRARTTGGGAAAAAAPPAVFTPPPNRKRRRSEVGSRAAEAAEARAADARRGRPVVETVDSDSDSDDDDDEDLREAKRRSLAEARRSPEPARREDEEDRVVCVVDDGPPL